MLTEQKILKAIRDLIPNSKKYLFDDAAIVEKDLIVTTDSLVENTHFTLKTSSPEEIGWKALAINLSDIAAMGGKPLYALVSLSLPVRAGFKPVPWTKKFYKGLLACAKKYKTQIIGGNLARANEINITITVIGKTLSKKIGKRSNAKASDLVFATGTFGDSACRSFVTKPMPQITLGQQIVKKTKRAALMDSSDGLADCLIQISNQSNVKIVIDQNKIPISKSTKLIAKKIKKDPLKLALYGGEDYQLVGTASPNDIKKLNKIKIIGKVVKGKNAYLKQNNGNIAKLDLKKTYDHFK